MAVLVDGSSVVVRNATLEQHYPGGQAAYREDCPNATFCADEHVSRVGFMRPDDAEAFEASLAGQWLAPFRLSPGEQVALVDGHSLTLRTCTWLELGRWGTAPIAWLKGTRRGDLHTPAGWDASRVLQYVSKEQASDQLEFVGMQEGVEVYRHTLTGETLYVGRTSAVSKDQRDRHSHAYQEACQLIQGLILLDGRPPAVLDAPARDRLSRALALFAEVVQINPQNWPAMWQLGKIHQRLGDRERCLQWFARAHLVRPDQPDVAREASIAAMELGRVDEAVRYCERALQAQPADPGLLANLGLALLLTGRPTDAHAKLLLAQRFGPSDAITANLLRIVREVVAGSRSCPRTIADLG